MPEHDPERRQHERRAHTVTFRRRQVGLAFGAITLAFVVGLVFAAHLAQQNHDRIKDIAALSLQNKQRISDIQQSRTDACIQSYEGVRQVFGPLLPKHPHDGERISIAKFYRTINRLERRCLVNVKGPP